MGCFRFWIHLIPVLAFALIGCGEREKSAQIRATPAYQKYFGQAPVPKEGVCFARVGYLPIAQDSSRLQPFPLFLFNEEKQLEKLIERLLNMEEFSPRSKERLLTFPKGTHLRSVRHTVDEVDIDLEFPEMKWDSAAAAGWAAALAATAGQFPEVKRVRVTHRGTPLAGGPPQGLKPKDTRVSQPGVPEPLMISGNWLGEEHPAEIQVSFDRPVSIEELLLQDQHGGKIEGDYYQSMFDMAVIIRPQQPESITAGMPLELRWKAVDSLGRSSEGKRVFFLQRVDR